MLKLRQFLRDVWRLSRPYYRSEEKWSAWGLLVSIVGLRLLLVGMTVILSFWNREFFNSLQDKDFSAFFELLFVYRRTPSGFMPGFCEIAAVYILVAVYYTFLSQWLQIRWRRWLTVRFLDEWLADRAYYRISLTTDRAAIGTDNPDQRIAEDIRDFVDNTLTLGISLLANVITLVSFLGHHHAVRREHPRLHGLGRTLVCHRGHMAHTPCRPPARVAAVPPTAR